MGRNKVKPEQASKVLMRMPIFCGAILRNANCTQVVWGWPSDDAPLRPGEVAASEQAVFMSTCLSGVSFDRARVRGYFHDCSLTDASLAFADFSQSNFAGNEDFNRFARATLIRTKVHYASIASARFDRAIIRGADFLGAELHPRISALLRARDAIHVV